VLSEDDIARMAATIARGTSPLVVGTFGSYAVGTAKDNSDLDLFVIERAAGPPFARARAIRRLLFGVLHPLDIHVFTPEEFERDADEALSFAWIIVRQSRVYYAAACARHYVPSLFGLEGRDAAT
jgi:predicted nucleotidyltransferase